MRLKEECDSLVWLAASIQCDLGPSLKDPSKISPRVLRSFQGIDRIEQTIRDFSNIMIALAQDVHGAKTSRNTLEQATVLKHLRSKLLDMEDSSFPEDEDASGDINWF